MGRSGIRAIMELALARPGTLRLELGEPDFATAPHIVEAAARAAAAGHTRYTRTAGIDELRAALAEKVRVRNGFDVDPADVLVSAGAVQGLYVSLVGLIDPGDEILLPSPGWPNYLMMSHLLRAVPRSYPLRAEEGYLPSVADLEALVTPRTRAIVLNSPSNPLGSVIDAERMRELVGFAREHGLWVISDECYDELVYDAPHVSAARFDDERVISVFSFSKTYAMTGWRVGYLALPHSVASTLTNAHEAMLSSVTTPAQYAALEAVTGPQDVVVRMREEYRVRRDLALDRLAAAGVPAFRPGGAFYLWIDIAESGLDGDAFARELVTRGLSLAPGPAFGPEGSRMVRMSIAASADDISRGVDILADLLAERRSATNRSLRRD